VAAAVKGTKEKRACQDYCSKAGEPSSSRKNKPGLETKKKWVCPGARSLGLEPRRGQLARLRRALEAGAARRPRKKRKAQLWGNQIWLRKELISGRGDASGERTWGKRTPPRTKKVPCETGEIAALKIERIHGGAVREKTRKVRAIVRVYGQLGVLAAES